MTKVIEKYYCDRCGKETDKLHYPELHLKIKRFRRKRLVTAWNSDYGQYEPCDLCKACAESFDEWWNAPHQKGDE